jgi:hypothetical protein
MKSILFFPFIIILFCNCISNTEPQKNNRIAPSSPTTLDSLQGAWRSNIDSNSKIRISNDTLFDIYLNQNIMTSKLFFSDSFTEDSLSIVTNLIGKTSGEYLIQNDIKYNDFSCYTIGYISNKDLVLRYRGKELSFSK